MYSLFYFYPLSGILHIFEEYVYPGGFDHYMRKMVPAFAPYITALFAIIFNGLFILLCSSIPFIGNQFPLFTLSVAALLGINALVHSIGAIKAKAYVPGLITALMLFVPLSIASYYTLTNSDAGPVIGISLLLGICYQIIPIIYLYARQQLG